MIYPLFEQYQLLEYKGDNKTILALKSKYIRHLLSKKTKYVVDLQADIKKQKPLNLLINRSDYGAIIESLNNIKGKRKVFIKCLPFNSIDQGKYIPVYDTDRVDISDEQNEYLIKNFMFQPIFLKENHEIKIGEVNKNFLNQQFKTKDTVNRVKITHLLGETNNHFHVAYKNNQFFLKKSDPDLDHPFYSLVNDVELDVEYYNQLCQWPEWVENNYKLKDHQIYAIKSILYHKKFAIFDRAGTGKTILSIVAALASGADKILVVTQLNLKDQWIDFIEYFGQSVSSFYNDMDELDVFAKFHVIHYNQLDNERGKKKPKYDFYQYKYDFIIADEAHGVKNIVGVRGKYISKLINQPHCKYTVPLTASPFEINEHVYEIFHNFGIDANGMIPVDEYNFQKRIDKQNDFKIRYAKGVMMKRNGRTFVSTFGDSNTHELAQRIKYYHLCRTSLDIEGFPDLNVYNLNLKLNAVEKSKYNLYKKELKEHYAKLKEKNKNNEYQINEELPTLVKIREFLAEIATKETINLARSKVKEGEKIIIFTHYQSEFDIITQYLADEAVWVHVNKANRWMRKDNQEILKVFKTSKDKNILVGNITTAGTGLNIPEADTCILNTPNWANGEHMQSMSRPRRLNRKDPVSVYVFVIKDTEIQKVYDVNERKRKNNNILLGLPEDFH